MTTPAIPHAIPPVSGPLDGLRVIELGTVVAGPFAGRLLADYGADVIKVEDPRRPDPLRDWGQRSYHGHKLWWTVHARNKRCVTLDLRSVAGQNMLADLAGRADVVIENFRPGTLERWNLGYERLSTVNPGLVLARISGFGQTGPYRDRPGYAAVAEAMGGLRAINGYPGQAPPRMGISMGDSLAGLFAVQGVLAALHRRGVTGHGQVVDVSLAEACMAMLESVIPEYDKTGYIRRPSGTRLEGIAPSNLYRSRDDRWLVVAANQDTVFARLCQAMGRSELTDDERFRDHRARGRHQDEIDAIVGSWVGERQAGDVLEILGKAGVVVGPVYTVDEIVADPHFAARDMIVDHKDERLGEIVRGPGIVPKFSATAGRVRWAGAARPGVDNAAVYGELLGIDAERLDRLAEAGVI
jgi:formyl-CoA transferase